MALSVKFFSSYQIMKYDGCIVWKLNVYNKIGLFGLSEKILFVYFSENLQIFIVAITQKLITCEGYERYIEPRQHVAKVCTNVLFVYV